MDPKIPVDGPQRPQGPIKSNRWIAWLVLLAALVIAYLVAEHVGVFDPKPPTAGKPATPAAGTPGAPGAPGAEQPSHQKKASLRQAPAPPGPSKHGSVVEVKPEQASGTEQAVRKAPYGLKRSVDVVVRGDETIKVGGVEVSVAELERSLVVGARGQVLDRPLGAGQGVTVWGVHLVRSKENLWNIHYHLLREFLASRGIALPPDADEPTANGRSTGVGKILKFAEHMVGVYNLKTRAMSAKLDLLEPGHKVVIFNLSEIFEQLAKIEPHNLKGVMYDGRVLLFPGSEIKPRPAGPAPPAATKHPEAR